MEPNHRVTARSSGNGTTDASRPTSFDTGFQPSDEIELGDAAAVDTAALLPREAESQGHVSLVGLPSKSALSRTRCLSVGLLGAGLLALCLCHFRSQPWTVTVRSTLVAEEVDASEGSSILSVQNLTDDKARSDPRTYQFAVLANGLQVLNIHDNQTLKASFAVAVKAGSYDDPEDLPGLAHFCEHMLFLGTKKYPNPSGFDNFMSKSGGFDNAYTAREVTVYFAELSESASREGLDRFADFFRAPLFNERYVKKEVHAIDSEHLKNVQDPYRRVSAVLNSIGNPQSPISRFYTGNKETLYDVPRRKGTNPVDALRVYFEGRYCPKMMRVVTFGPSSLEEQLHAVSKNFASIDRGGTACGSSRRNFSEPNPWPAESRMKWLTIKGTKPQAELWVQWFLPDVSREYLSHPLQYLHYVLSYRGVNSLSRVLEDGLGLAVSCQVMLDEATTGTMLFFVVTLAKPGVAHLELVLDVLFAYMARLLHDGVDRDLYQSVADMGRLRWSWAEPAGPFSTVSGLAERMTRLPAEHLLSGESRIDKLNVPLVAELLAKISPDNMNIAHVNPNATNQTFFEGVQVQTLPYYGVEFAVQEISAVLPSAPAQWSRWLQGSDGIGFSEIQEVLEAKVRHAALARDTSLAVLPLPPRPIRGIPKHIALDNMRAQRLDDDGTNGALLFGPRPVQLDAKQEESATNNHKPRSAVVEAQELWYRSGWVTTSPKVTVQMLLRPRRLPLQEVAALDALRLELYNRLFEEEVAPKAVDLTATGVWYSASVSRQGLSFSFGGFAPLLPRLVDMVMREFNRFNANTSITGLQRFERLVEELRHDLEAYTSMPVSYAEGDLALLLLHGPHSRNESIAVLGNISIESASRSVGELMLSRPLELTALAMGNIAELDAQALIQTVSQGLQLPDWLPPSSAMPGGHVERVTPVVNPSRPVELRKKNPRPGDPNDVVIVAILAGVSTVLSRVELGLLGRILGTLAYNELRTSRQLGYVVNAASSSVSNVHYISAMVQGTLLPADDVEVAIEYVFTELMPQRLRNITEEEFGSFITSLRQDLTQSPVGASQEVGHFWGPVEQGGLCFELRSEMLRCLDTPHLLSRRRLADLWRRLAAPKDRVRKRLVVKYFAGDVPPRGQAPEAEAAWQKEGLGVETVELLRRERERTLYLDRADAATRAQLAEGGGYFPQDLHCTVEKELPAA